MWEVEGTKWQHLQKKKKTRVGRSEELEVDERTEERQQSGRDQKMNDKKRYRKDRKVIKALIGISFNVSCCCQ